MRFIKIEKPEDIVNEYIEEHYPTPRNPGLLRETGIAIGSSLGGLALTGQGVVNSLKSSTLDKFNLKPLIIGTGLGLGTYLGGNIIAKKLAADKRKAFKKKFEKEQPDYDSRLSPYVFYNDNRPLATFRSFVNIPVDKKLADELDLSEREKHLGVADPKTLAAQAALIGVPLAYTTHQNRKIHRALIGESVVRQLKDTVDQWDSIPEIGAAARQRYPDFIKTVETYTDLIESPIYRQRLKNAQLKKNLGVVGVIGGTAIAGHLGKKALENRARKKTEAYLANKKFSKNDYSFVNFSAFDKATAYELPANTENSFFPENTKYSIIPATLGTLGLSGILAGSAREPSRELEIFNRDKINKDIPIRVDRALNDVKRLKGRPSAKQLFYKLGDLSPKTYRNIKHIGLGLTIAGGVIGVNSYANQAALQRQLQTQAQLEALQRRKDKK